MTITEQVLGLTADDAPEAEAPPAAEAAAPILTAHRLGDVLHHLGHAAHRMKAARDATGDLRQHHAAHLARHLKDAQGAAHGLAGNIRARYPAEAAELEQVKDAVGLAKAVSGDAKAATTAHLLETSLHEIAHADRHAQAMTEGDPGSDEWSFNADHAEKHLSGAAEHAGKLRDHLADNYPDEAQWLGSPAPVTGGDADGKGKPQHARYDKGGGETITAQLANWGSITGQVAELTGDANHRHIPGSPDEWEHGYIPLTEAAAKSHGGGKVPKGWKAPSGGTGKAGTSAYVKDFKNPATAAEDAKMRQAVKVEDYDTAVKHLQVMDRLEKKAGAGEGEGLRPKIAGTVSMVKSLKQAKQREVKALMGKRGAAAVAVSETAKRAVAASPDVRASLREASNALYRADHHGALRHLAEAKAASKADGASGRNTARAITAHEKEVRDLAAQARVLAKHAPKGIVLQAAEKADLPKFAGSTSQQPGMSAADLRALAKRQLAAGDPHWTETVHKANELEGKPQWRKDMEAQAAKLNAAGEANSRGLDRMMALGEARRMHMSAQGVPIPPHPGDMRSGEEYRRASDLIYAGKYAEGSAGLQQAIDKAAGERNSGGEVKRLTAYKKKLDKALAGSLPDVPPSLARVRGSNQGMTVIDHNGVEHEISLKNGQVTVTRGGKSASAPAGDNPTMTARKLAGQLAGTALSGSLS